MGDFLDFSFFEGQSPKGAQGQSGKQGGAVQQAPARPQATGSSSPLPGGKQGAVPQLQAPARPQAIVSPSPLPSPAPSPRGTKQQGKAASPVNVASPPVSPRGRGGRKKEEKVDSNSLDFAAFSQLAKDLSKEEKKAKARRKKSSKEKTHRDSESESDAEAEEGEEQQQQEEQSDEEEMCNAPNCKRRAVLESKCVEHLKQQEAEKGKEQQEGAWTVSLVQGETKFKLARNLVEWKFEYYGVVHMVELHHSPFSGKRTVYVDGVRMMVAKPLVYLDGSARHTLSVVRKDNRRLDIEVVIREQALSFVYDLYINGLTFKQARNQFLQGYLGKS